ncbi:AAA family ATPase [Streptomyces sp. NPDC006529]|uniref:AAA family ATPase n=1 Tax=Streptomyces sp. NPDC006529 TaxID=3157177 RepID=UPI0033BA32A7
MQLEVPKWGDKPDLKLAISGTYSTGKSTTTEALAIATGIPRTHAKTSRELLVDLVPGKTVMELNAMELVKLGLRRYEERLVNEAGTGAFISDGGVFHEWVYFEARMRVGINPGMPWWFQGVKKTLGVVSKGFYQKYTNTLGEIQKDRAKRSYDAFVHLPVEFDMDRDGHRPVSEKFRRLSDELLLGALEETKIPYRIVGGPIPQRIEKIVEIFELPLVVPIKEAIEEAERRVAADASDLQRNLAFMASRRQKSFGRRLAYALRY